MDRGIKNNIGLKSKKSVIWNVDKWREGWTDKQTGKQMDEWINRWTERQTE
jgi:hypothetical protein